MSSILGGNKRRDYIEIEKIDWFNLVAGILLILVGIMLAAYDGWVMLMLDINIRSMVFPMMITSVIFGFLMILFGAYLIDKCKHMEKFYVKKEQ